MPVISGGGMRYQHKWQDVPPEEIPRANQKNLAACISRALELGINHIETALHMFQGPHLVEAGLRRDFKLLYHFKPRPVVSPCHHFMRLLSSEQSVSF